MLEHTKILNCGISQQRRDAMIPLLSRNHFWEYHACPSLVFSRVNGCGPADGPELWLLGVPAAGEASGRLLPVPGVPAGGEASGGLLPVPGVPATGEASGGEAPCRAEPEGGVASRPRLRDGGESSSRGVTLVERFDIEPFSDSSAK